MFSTNVRHEHECESKQTFSFQMETMRLWLALSSTETLVLLCPSRGNFFFRLYCNWPSMKYILLTQDGAPTSIFSFRLTFLLYGLADTSHSTIMSHTDNTDCVILFLHSNTTLLNSKVVTVIVKPTPTLLSSPVEIEFPHLHNVSPKRLPNLMEPYEKYQSPSGCLLTAVHRAWHFVDICSDTVTFTSQPQPSGQLKMVKITHSN